MQSIFGAKASEPYYKELCIILRKHLIKWDSTIVASSILEIDWSIADVNIVKSNFYDEHLFVYLLGRGTKESYWNELHSNLIVNICQDPSKSDHPSNIMFLMPNNIVFSTVLYKFVTDACFRMQIINESWFELLVDYNNEKGLRCELLSM